MIINNNSVEQINVALLDLEKKLSTIKNSKSDIDSLKDSINTIKASLNETKAGLTSGATYDINITGNATTATTATKAGSAVSAESAERASKDGNGNSITSTYATKNDLTKAVPTYSADDAGKNLAVNGDGTGTEWVKPQTVKFVDYRTGNFTFDSLTDQKKIELSNFGPEVTENNVLSFMVIYWHSVPTIAQGDWAKSQGTGSSGLACALHALSAGTGWCVIRCVYLA